MIRLFSSTDQKDSTPKDGMVHITIEEAKLKTKEALEKIGWDESDAHMQAEIMVHAELCGNNQGLVKMYQPKMMAPDPRAGVPEVVRETRNSAVIDGNQAPGMIVALTACDMAMEKLASRGEQNAISIVVSFNSSTSSGQLGYYVDRMARHGCIGIGMCNSPEFVAAAPGGKPVFGTNPLAVGVPVSGQEYPFVVRRFIALFMYTLVGHSNKLCIVSKLRSLFASV
jgi:LDH2 family malate/lactate/ureidoglycolate dehydrogenase